MPTAENAITLELPVMFTPGAPAPRPFNSGSGVHALRRTDREGHLANQRLVRDLIRDLDLQPILPFRERRERHGLPALQLMTGREIELRRQRLRVEILRIRLVEELLAGLARFARLWFASGGRLAEDVLDED